MIVFPEMWRRVMLIRSWSSGKRLRADTLTVRAPSETTSYSNSISDIKIKSVQLLALGQSEFSEKDLINLGY
jgi:hypothetical protein